MLSKDKLIQSKRWFEFASTYLANDKEVKKQISRYLDAQFKLNQRIAELAKSSTELDIDFEKLSREDAFSGGLMRQVKEYIDLHSPEENSIESLTSDALANGFETSYFSLKQVDKL